MIFVIDDDPGMLKGIGRLLRAHGLEVRLFASAEAFQEQVDQHEASCLVVDIHLGGMSGIELRRQLSRSGSSLPVVFITANDSDKIRRAAIEAGCIAYLAKPISTEALIDAINKALTAA